MVAVRQTGSSAVQSTDLRVTVSNLSPDPAGEGHRPGEFDDGDIRVQRVGVPGVVLDGSGDPDVHRTGPVTAGGDVVVAQPHVVWPGAPRDGIKAVGGREHGVLIEESPPAHHLEPGAEPLSAHDDGPGPGPGLRLGASDNLVPLTDPALPARCWGWCGCGGCVVAAGGFAASLRAFGGLELPMAPLSGKPGVSHVAAARANLVASVRCGCKATVVMLSSLHRYRSW